MDPDYQPDPHQWWGTSIIKEGYLRLTPSGEAQGFIIPTGPKKKFCRISQSGSTLATGLVTEDGEILLDQPLKFVEDVRYRIQISGEPFSERRPKKVALSKLEEEDLQAELGQRHREIAKAIRHLLRDAPPDLQHFAGWQHHEIAKAVAKAIGARLRGHQIREYRDTVGAIERWILNQRLMGERDLLRLAKIGLERGIPVVRRRNEAEKLNRLRLLRAEIDRIREPRPRLSLRAVYNNLLKSKQSSLLVPPGSAAPMSWQAFFKKVKTFNLAPRRDEGNSYQPAWINDEPPDPPLPFNEALRRVKARLAKRENGNQAVTQTP